MNKPISFFFVFAILCNIICCNNKQQQLDPQVDSLQNLYSRLEKITDKNSDSILFYAKLLEANSAAAPVEYKAMAALALGHYYNVKFSGQLPLREYNHALELLKFSSADTLIARAYNGIAVSYLKMSDYPAALDYFFKSLRIYEKQNNLAGIAGVNSNLGEAYQQKGELNLAVTFQSMERMSSPGWYSRTSLKVIPLPLKAL